MPIYEVNVDKTFSSLPESEHTCKEHSILREEFGGFTLYYPVNQLQNAHVFAEISSRIMNRKIESLLVDSYSVTTPF